MSYKRAIKPVLTGNRRGSIYTGSFRDGPLENLWGGGGGGRSTKKYSRKGKLNEKKSMHAN